MYNLTASVRGWRIQSSVPQSVLKDRIVLKAVILQISPSALKGLFMTSGQSQSTHLKLLCKLLFLFTAGGGCLETFASLVLGIKGSLEGAHHFEAVISMITVHKEQGSCCTDR